MKARTIGCARLLVTRIVQPGRVPATKPAQAAPDDAGAAAKFLTTVPRRTTLGRTPGTVGIAVTGGTIDTVVGAGFDVVQSSGSGRMCVAGRREKMAQDGCVTRPNAIGRDG